MLKQGKKPFKNGGNRKLRRYANKHKCDLNEAYQQVYGFKYRKKIRPQ